MNGILKILKNFFYFSILQSLKTHPPRLYDL